jgi:hypothetical protein
MTIEPTTLHAAASPVNVNEAVQQKSAVKPSEDSDIEREKWAVPEDALAKRLAAHSGPVLVDLDETLYLRNSTEEFIGLAVPNIIAAYLLRILELAAPWKFLGGNKCRDNWRVLFVLILFPWTYLRWKNHCKVHVPQFINQPLRDSLRAHSKHVVIASNGYQLLIRPMISAFDLPGAALVSCHLLRFKHRRDGKLKLLDTAHDREFIAKALVITDSYSDADLLRVCKAPCLTVWRNALFKHAFDGLVYLPTDYLNRVKRPRQGALRSLVIYDLLPWILVGLSVAPSFLELLGLILLFLSMWSIYEVGYFDNDQCGVKYEHDPKLTPEAQHFNGHYFKTKAWLTALVLGAIAIGLINSAAFMKLSALWVVALLSLNAVYWIYNRIDKTTRTWLYPALQIFRFGALFAVVPIAAVAYAAVFSQVFCRWVNYIIYRQQRSATGVTKWPKTADQSIRLVTFIMLVLPLVLSGRWQELMVPASACLIIFVYGFWKYDWKTFRDGFHRLDKKQS